MMFLSPPSFCKDLKEISNDISKGIIVAGYMLGHYLQPTLPCQLIASITFSKIISFG